MVNRNLPRLPSADEREALTEHIVFRNYGFGPRASERQEIENVVARAQIAVFDHYVSDGPGYSGKLLLVVWPGSVEMFEAYVWEDGKLAARPQDAQFSERT